MEVPAEIVGIAGGAMIALQAWTLSEVVKLKTKVAVIVATCNACNGNTPKMKQTSLGLIALIATCTALLTGCGSIYTKTPGNPAIVTQPVYSVDPAGNLVKVGETNLPAPAETWALSPGWSNSLAAAQAFAAVGAAAPSPAQPAFAIAALALTGFSGLLGLYARKRNNQLTLANAALGATVTVIEAAQDAAALKEAARKAATANGSQDYLHNTVKNL